MPDLQTREKTKIQKYLCELLYAVAVSVNDRRTKN